MVYSYCPCCAKIDNQENEKCDFCNTNLIKTDIIYRFTDWAVNKSKIEVDLIYKFQIEDNPLFDIKMYQKRIKQENPNGGKFYKDEKPSFSFSSSSLVKCPYCKSTNVSKISTVSRVTSVAMVGIASSKIGKQWHCNGCGSNF